MSKPIVSKSSTFDYDGLIQKALYVYFHKKSGNHLIVDKPYVVIKEHENKQVSFVELEIANDGISIRSDGTTWETHIDKSTIREDVNAAIMDWLKQLNYEIFINQINSKQNDNTNSRSGI